jgi:hypothetical protein
VNLDAYGAELFAVLLLTAAGLCGWLALGLVRRLCRRG